MGVFVSLIPGQGLSLVKFDLIVTTVVGNVHKLFQAIFELLTFFRRKPVFVNSVVMGSANRDLLSVNYCHLESDEIQFSPLKIANLTNVMHFCRDSATDNAALKEVRFGYLPPPFHFHDGSPRKRIDFKFVLTFEKG